jgi:flagellar biosynthesis chaperone FliJ
MQFIYSLASMKGTQLNMSANTTMERTTESPLKPYASVQLKRQVTVKTKVTDAFRARANDELNNELKLIDTQLQQLEAQYQYSLQQLEKVAQQGQNVQQQLQQLNQEAQQKRSQLASLKMQVSSELGNLGNLENGQYIVTGMLENTVEVRVGENIYDKLQNAEILIEDGVVTSING